METIQIILLGLVIVLALPFGYLLARFTREELKEGRKAFLAIIVISLIISAVTLFLPLADETKTFLIFSAVFIAALTSISLFFSYKPYNPNALAKKTKKTGKTKKRRK
jgi:MFS family permease